MHWKTLKVGILIQTKTKPWNLKEDEMLVANYPTKIELKGSIGQPLRYEETSIFSPEYDGDGRICVVGPSAYKRKWYAEIIMENNLIKKVT